LTLFTDEDEIEITPPVQKFQEGESVIYIDGMDADEYLRGDFDASVIGRVLRIVPKVTYEYVVEWADDAETDTYPEDVLGPVPAGVNAASYIQDRFKFVNDDGTMLRIR
jgi:hypothetical protein